MNSDLDFSDDFAPSSLDERWMDAILSEHARLGQGDDEELVFRILQDISKPEDAEDDVLVSPIVESAAKEGQRRKKMQLSVFWGAAAVVILLATALSTIQVGRKIGDRHPEEIRFFVQMAPSEKTALGDATVTPLVQVARAADDTNVVELVVGPEEARPAVLPVRTSPLIVPSVDFAPSFATLPKTDLRIEDFRITADRSSSSPAGLVYEGDVLVENGVFRISAASVQLPLPGSVQDRATLAARGVRVERLGLPCIVEAESLQFDPVIRQLILDGVSRAKTDQGELNSFSREDRIILTELGFAVERVSSGDGASPSLLQR